jgi:hypothetical protein
VKLNRILPVAGALTLLASAALAQAPNFPAGGEAGVYRPRPGAHVDVDRTFDPAVTNKRAVSMSCSQQADARGLHGKARQTFRDKCVRRGGR